MATPPPQPPALSLLQLLCPMEADPPKAGTAHLRRVLWLVGCRGGLGVSGLGLERPRGGVEGHVVPETHVEQVVQDTGRARMGDARRCGQAGRGTEGPRSRGGGGGEGRRGSRDPRVRPAPLHSSRHAQCFLCLPHPRRQPSQKLELSPPPPCSTT